MITVEANGAKIPALGFGTWDLRGEVASSMVAKALELGYRHIDTARMYGNEAEVGAGMRASGVPRDEIFLTTKIWFDDFRNEDFRRAAQASLEALGLDCVDLLLLHWPSHDVPLEETMEALNWARASGITRHIGVSNFTVRLMADAVRLSTFPIVCNQVEYHPYLSQKKVLPAARGHGMALVAYAPIVRGKVADDPVLNRIGKAHGKSATQVTLRWLVQQDGVVAIPRTSRPERAKANMEIFDFELTSAQMDEIAALGSPEGRTVNMAWAPAWD